MAWLRGRLASDRKSDCQGEMGHMDIKIAVMVETCGKWRAQQRKRSGVSLVSCTTVTMTELKSLLSSIFVRWVGTIILI